MKQLLTIEEVAELLKIPESSLHYQRERSRPPGALGVRIGKHIRWEPDVLERWIAEQRSQTNSRGRPPGGPPSLRNTKETARRRGIQSQHEASHDRR